MARSPALNARSHGIGIAAGGSKHTPPVGQINGHHSLGKLHQIAQNTGRRYVILKSDGHKRRARLLRPAEFYAPAEQEPRDDPMLASNAGDRRSRLPAFHRDRELLFVAEERRAGVVGAVGASFEGTVKLLSASDWLAPVAGPSDFDW